MTDRRQCCKPIPQLIGRLNRHLKGWANYFSLGLSAASVPEDQLASCGYRLTKHLKHVAASGPTDRRKGCRCYEHLQRLGLEFLRASNCLREPADEGFQESRMREICTSGSTRGQWVAPQCRPLSYSTGQFFAVHIVSPIKFRPFSTT